METKNRQKRMALEIKGLLADRMKSEAAKGIPEVNRIVRQLQTSARK